MKLKLQVALVPALMADAPAGPSRSFRKFLHLADPLSTIGDVCDALLSRYHKLYPDADPLLVEGVQDSNCCDLDPDFAAEDVFALGDLLRIIVSDYGMLETFSTILPPDATGSKRSASLDVEDLRFLKRSRTIWGSRLALESARPLANTSMVSPVAASTNARRPEPAAQPAKAAQAPHSSPTHVPAANGLGPVLLPPPDADYSASKIIPHKRASPHTLGSGRRITSGMLQAPAAPPTNVFSDNDDTDASEAVGHFSRVVQPNVASSDIEEDIENGTDSDRLVSNRLLKHLQKKNGAPVVPPPSEPLAARTPSKRGPLVTLTPQVSRGFPASGDFMRTVIETPAQARKVAPILSLLHGHAKKTDAVPKEPLPMASMLNPVNTRTTPALAPVDSTFTSVRQKTAPAKVATQPQVNHGVSVIETNQIAQAPTSQPQASQSHTNHVKPAAPSQSQTLATKSSTQPDSAIQSVLSSQTGPVTANVSSPNQVSLTETNIAMQKDAPVSSQVAQSSAVAHSSQPNPASLKNGSAAPVQLTNGSAPSSSVPTQASIPANSIARSSATSSHAASETSQNVVVLPAAASPNAQVTARVEIPATEPTSSPKQGTFVVRSSVPSASPRNDQTSKAALGLSKGEILNIIKQNGKVPKKINKKLDIAPLDRTPFIDAETDLKERLRLQNSIAHTAQLIEKRRSAARPPAANSERSLRSRVTLVGVPNFETNLEEGEDLERGRSLEIRAKALPQPFQDFTSKSKLSSIFIKMKKLDAKIAKEQADRAVQAKPIKKEPTDRIRAALLSPVAQKKTGGRQNAVSAKELLTGIATETATSSSELEAEDEEDDNEEEEEEQEDEEEDELPPRSRASRQNNVSLESSSGSSTSEKSSSDEDDSEEEEIVQPTRRKRTQIRAAYKRRLEKQFEGADIILLDSDSDNSDVPVSRNRSIAKLSDENLDSESDSDSEISEPESFKSGSSGKLNSSSQPDSRLSTAEKRNKEKSPEANTAEPSFKVPTSPSNPSPIQVPEPSLEQTSPPSTSTADLAQQHNSLPKVTTPKKRSLEATSGVSPKKAKNDQSRASTMLTSSGPIASEPLSQGTQEDVQKKSLSHVQTTPISRDSENTSAKLKASGPETSSAEPQTPLGRPFGAPVAAVVQNATTKTPQPVEAQAKITGKAGETKAPSSVAEKIKARLDDSKSSAPAVTAPVDKATPEKPTTTPSKPAAINVTPSQPNPVKGTPTGPRGMRTNPSANPSKKRKKAAKTTNPVQAAKPAGSLAATNPAEVSEKIQTAPQVKPNEVRPSEVTPAGAVKHTGLNLEKAETAKLVTKEVSLLNHAEAPKKALSPRSVASKKADPPKSVESTNKTILLDSAGNLKTLKPAEAPKTAVSASVDLSKSSNGPKPENSKKTDVREKAEVQAPKSVTLAKKIEASSSSDSDSSSESEDDKSKPASQPQPALSRLLPKRFGSLSKPAKPVKPATVEPVNTYTKGVKTVTTATPFSKSSSEEAPAPKKEPYAIKKPLLTSLSDLAKRGVPEVKEKSSQSQKPISKPIIKAVSSDSESSSDSDSSSSDSSDSSDLEEEQDSKFVSLKNLSKGTGKAKKRQSGFSSLMKDAKKR